MSAQAANIDVKALVQRHDALVAEQASLGYSEAALTSAKESVMRLSHVEDEETKRAQKDDRIANAAAKDYDAATHSTYARMGARLAEFGSKEKAQARLDKDHKIETEARADSEAARQAAEAAHAEKAAAFQSITQLEKAKLRNSQIQAELDAIYSQVYRTIDVPAERQAKAHYDDAESHLEIARSERDKHEAILGALEAARQSLLRAEAHAQKGLDVPEYGFAIGNHGDRTKMADLAAAKSDAIEAVQHYERAQAFSAGSVAPLPSVAERLGTEFDESLLQTAHSDAEINNRIKHGIVEVDVAAQHTVLQEQAEIPAVKAARKAVVDATVEYDAARADLNNVRRGSLPQINGTAVH